MNPEENLVKASEVVREEDINDHLEYNESLLHDDPYVTHIMKRVSNLYAGIRVAIFELDKTKIESISNKLTADCVLLDNLLKKLVRNGISSSDAEVIRGLSVIQLYKAVFINIISDLAKLAIDRFMAGLDDILEDTNMALCHINVGQTYLSWVGDLWTIFEQWIPGEERILQEVNIARESHQKVVETLNRMDGSFLWRDNSTDKPSRISSTDYNYALVERIKKLKRLNKNPRMRRRLRTMSKTFNEVMAT